MYDYLEKRLRKFIHEEKTNNVENCGSRNCYMNIENTGIVPKPTLNIVFSKYQGAETTYTDLGKHGYVLALPAYWIDVDEYTAIYYISSFVDKWLIKQFGYNADETEEDDNDKDKHHCEPHVHPPHPPIPHPPHPVPPPPPPVTPPPPMQVVSTGGISQYGYPVRPGD